MKNKKFLRALASFMLSGAAAVGCFSIFGCGHSHTYSEDWKNDTEKHWHEATCEHTEEKADEAAHEFDSNGKCVVCDYQKPQPEKHQHTWATEWSSNENEHWKNCTDPDCNEVTEKGSHTVRDGECIVCHKEIDIKDPVTKYSVTFNVHGHGTAPEGLTEVTVLPELAELTEEGWTFGGWYYDEDCQNKANAGDALTGNVTLHAKWTKDGETPVTKYSVTFNVHGHGTAPEGLTEVTVLPELAELTEEGWTFGGWYYDEGYQTKANEGDTLTANVTLHAKWTVIEVPGVTYYDVVFDSDNGSAVAPQRVAQNGKVEEPSAPVKEGYTFVKWVIVNADESETDFDFDTAVTANITLKAKWNEIVVTNIEFERTRLDLYVDATTQLVPTITPSNALNKTLTYKSGDENIVTVDEDGNVTAIASGETKITVTAASGVYKEIPVSVTVRPAHATAVDYVVGESSDRVTLSPDKPSDTITLKITTESGEPCTDTVSWVSSDPSIATVTPSADGFSATVTMITQGDAPIVITATVNGISVKIQCTADTYYGVLVNNGETKAVHETFVNYKDGDILDEWSGTWGTAGVYGATNNADGYTATGNAVVIKAEENGNNRAEMIDTTNKATHIVIDFGKLDGVVKGYANLKTTSIGNSWTPIQFFGASEKGSSTEVFGIRTDGGVLKYRLDGNSTLNTAENAISSANDTTYRLYYEFDLKTGKVTIKINGQNFVTGLQTQITAIHGVKFVSSDNNARTISVDNIIVTNVPLTAGEYAEKALESLNAEYNKYVALQPEEGEKAYTEENWATLVSAYNTAKSAIEAEGATKEDMQTAYDTGIAAMKAVPTKAATALADAKTAATEELNGIDKTKYTVNADALDKALTAGLAAIEAAKTTDAVTEALNTAKTSIAEIDNDEAAVTNAKVIAIHDLTSFEGGADNFTEEGEGGNKTAYEQAIAAGTKAINDVTVSESLTPVQAIEAIQTALEEAKAAISEIDTNAQLLEKAQTAAITEIDELVKTKNTEIDAVTDATDEAKAKVKDNIASMREARVSAINAASSLAAVESEKNLAISNITTEAATLTETADQLKARVKKAIEDHATEYIRDYPEYTTAIEKLRDEAIADLEKDELTNKAEISNLQTTTTRAISVYVAKQEAYKDIDNYAEQLKNSIYNDTAKSEIEAEVLRGNELSSSGWSAHMWTLHNTVEVAKVEENKKVVLDALDKIVSDLVATKFTVTLSGSLDTMEILYGETITVADIHVTAKKVVAVYTDETKTTQLPEEGITVYDNLTLYVEVEEIENYVASSTWTSQKVAESTVVSDTVIEENSLYSLNVPSTANYLSKDVNWNSKTFGGVTIDSKVFENALNIGSVPTNSDNSASPVIIKVKENLLTLSVYAKLAGSNGTDGRSGEIYYVVNDGTPVSTKAIDKSFTINNLKAGDIVKVYVYNTNKSGGNFWLAQVEAAIDENKVPEEVEITWVDSNNAQTSNRYYEGITLADYVGEGAFQYWYYLDGDKEVKVENGTKLTAGKYEMHAKVATANVTITYIVDENETSVKYYVAPETAGVTNTVADPVKEGYTFIGWYNSETNEKFDFNAVTADSNVKVYAVFEENKAIISTLVIGTDAGFASSTALNAKNIKDSQSLLTLGSANKYKNQTVAATSIGETTVTNALLSQSNSKGCTLIAGSEHDIEVTLYISNTDSSYSSGKKTTITWTNSGESTASTYSTTGVITAQTITVKIAKGQSVDITVGGNRLVIFGAVIKTTD